ncbi:uncharacterized protein K452DRAFT_155196 [Aplosporella prunicola CBS 121167]|uniref:WAC domain-containing protein n=1 Tax=Aplosporella prunicola CBS 121167 TaxID=1176127 RepID=A0A6A6BJC9_9PEZI|nr:uncharacterized protein K452DRAFT_155196 [Aplosporella prunicola CBS 121167]KAF2144232.1 hypothetical protein K452DRAFT_155196 [Aplosporella prunicola CBS 121167]
MVLCKRTPVTYVPPPTGVNDNQLVWTMKLTGEIFTDYDEYIKRLDYYRTKQFTNFISGQSGLTFFDAYEAEDENQREVERLFPPALRFHVCRRVHHSTSPRLDDLVKSVYRELQHDFYPGEDVLAHVEDSTDRLRGTIRDKITFSDATRNQAPLSRYFVTIEGGEAGQSDALLDSKCLSRNRNQFTRGILRSYIRHVSFKEGYNDAPWQVKPHLVAEFKLPAAVPYELTKEGIQLRKKQEAAATKSDTQFFEYVRGPNQQMQKQAQSNFIHQFQAQPVPIPQAGIFKTTPSGAMQPYFPQPTMPYPFPAEGHYPAQTSLPQRPTQQAAPQPPDRPVKYPIEDLMLPLSRNGSKRPACKFLSDDVPDGAQPPTEKLGIAMKNVGKLLSLWQTLNVHSEVFILDSFTVDDFIDALKFDGDANNCELLVEIHCAMLKQLVGADGKTLVLSDISPEFSEEVEPEEGADEDESTPEREETPPARRTRASLNKLAEKEPEPETKVSREPVLKNRSHKFLKSFNWIKELSKRNFQGGGWQAILVGVILQATLYPSHKENSEQILAHLMPLDMKPEVETARVQFNTMDINLRIAALEILCRYAISTVELRGYMATCSTNMTTIRNSKMERQKLRKELLKKLVVLEQRLKTTENPSQSPPQDANGDVSMTGTEEPDATEEPSIVDTEDEKPTKGRVLRKGNSLKRKRGEQLPKKVETAEEKKQKEWKKLNTEIENLRKQIGNCEVKIEDYDEELRQNYCQQLRPLGRDRFCNTYYWLERWGMPMGGLPTSSTASYKYVSGRVWVHGPDEQLHHGLLNLSPGEDAEYKLDISVKDRREHEEGPGYFSNANEWGYYDDPEDIKKLIDWLNDKGFREVKLKKELVIWQDSIVERMKNWKKHMAEVEADKTAEDDSSGIQTRKKAYHDAEEVKRPCLKWKNTWAVEEFGNKHYGRYPKKAKKGGRRSS